MSEHTPFLEIFPGCEALASAAGGLQKAYVTDVQVNAAERTLTVAVMGCVVNGPGEAREADYGIAGGKEKGILFKKGQVLGTYPYEQLCGALMDLIMKDTKA